MDKTRKISLSSIDYLVLARELSRELCGAWVDNVYYEPKYGYYLFKFRVEGVVKKLIVIPGEAVFITRYDYPVPEKPPAHLMRLRKFVQNLRVENVEQHDFDRILIISLSGKGFRGRLIIECLKKGALVLVSEDWLILFTSYRLETGVRVLEEGRRYVFPPSNIMDPRSLGDFQSLSEFASERIDRFIAGKLGFGTKIMNEICARTGLAQNTKVNGNMQTIIDTARMLIREAEEKASPRLYYSNASPIEVSGISLTFMRDFEQKVFTTLSEAVDEYYATLGFETTVEDKASKELEGLLKARENMVLQADMLKLKAKTIMDNLHLFQTILENVKNGKEVPEEVKVVERDYVKNRIRVLFKNVEYLLDLNSSAASNASRMFEEAKKIEKHVSEVDAKIAALKEKTVCTGRMVPEKRIEEKKWYEKFRWNTSVNGNLILAGKDAGTNELLVKKYVSENSIVLHADFIGAPFVTIYGVENPSEEELREAALMAACYTTRAWESKYASLDVYWVRGNQLSKQAPPGQYLPKGAFMVYGEKNFIRNVEMKLWVGITEENEIVYGCFEKVKSKCTRYAYVIPGSKNKDEEASRIVEKFLKDRSLPRREVVRLRELVKNIIPGRHCEAHYAS
ncbi:MAG: ribosome rescue protein RqcH [Thermoproteota archaeon]|nr:NFACT family protein [Candidatus Brockarchaeota archaeon]